MDPEPDPDLELSEKSDPDPEPDPEIIFSAPTYCTTDDTGRCLKFSSCGMKHVTFKLSVFNVKP